jgi:hypothetical protein
MYFCVILTMLAATFLLYHPYEDSQPATIVKTGSLLDSEDGELHVRLNDGREEMIEMSGISPTEFKGCEGKQVRLEERQLTEADRMMLSWTHRTSEPFTLVDFMEPCEGGKTPRTTWAPGGYLSGSARGPKS